MRWRLPEIIRVGMTAYDASRDDDSRQSQWMRAVTTYSTEVANLLKLNPQTVRNWIDAGKLPAAHVGRRVRIKRADLDALVEAGYRGRAPTDGYTATAFWDGSLMTEAFVRTPDAAA